MADFDKSRIDRATSREFRGGNVLCPAARLLSYKGSYPKYLERGSSERVEVEPWTTRA